MFEFPDDARWDEVEDAVAFTVRLGEYEGTIFLSRRLLQAVAGGRLSPEACLGQYHLHRTEFERLAERRIRERRLDSDANIHITGRDLRQR